ncbi:MAG: glucose 1-dehydrogenase [Methylacidiphilales bacterium]|nr:glucose 1-dehydrogenase [Candidatus Methylacidiphilales bacterium]
MKLSGKVALVTGSSQGIGQAIAVRLAEEGADIVINYHSHPDEADGVKAQITGLSRRAVAIGADLGNVDSVYKLISDGVTALGQIDILVNNAGVEKNASFWDVTEHDYDFVLNTNLKGPFFATQAFVKHLQSRKAPGKIINISSVHEDLPFPHFTSYCASKGGLKMMTRNLSIELAPFGITINNVAPGAIETPINTALLHDPAKLNALLQNIPLNRLGKPADISSAVAFLASSEADYITGTTLVIDGGLTWNYSEQ